MFSTRFAVDSSPNPLTVSLERKRRAGSRLLDLTLSNPTRAEIPYAEAQILTALANPAALQYQPIAFGQIEARRAVARSLGLQAAAAERIILTASTSESYAFAFKLLCDPGDEVLVPQPSYPLLEHLAAFEWVRLSPYTLAYDGAWHLDFSSIERAVSPRTRAIIVVNPNNPTGSYLKREELTRLSRLGLPIISDEVFFEYPLKALATKVRARDADSVLSFSLGGLSKSAGLPQMKLGWMLVEGPKDLVTRALTKLELLADAYLSVNTPVQLATRELLDTASRAQSAIYDRCQQNLASLRAQLQGSKLTVLDLEAGWYGVLRLPATQTEETWVLEFLEQDDTLVHPGWFYDFSSEAFIVISLLTPPSDFAEGVGRVVRRVEALA